MDYGTGETKAEITNVIIFETGLDVRRVKPYLIYIEGTNEGFSKCVAIFKL